MNSAITLRPVAAGDEPFLRTLYLDVHGDDFALLDADAAAKSRLLDSQFEIQSAQYLAEYPEADHGLVMYADRPVGRLLVNRSGAAAIHLVDISLLASQRRHGIGTYLLQGLIEEARSATRPLELHVAITNPAAQLYRRLGFQASAYHGPFVAMTLLP